MRSTSGSTAARFRFIVVGRVVFAFFCVGFRIDPGSNFAIVDIQQLPNQITLCYAIVLPGRKSGLRAGCRLNSSRESSNNFPPTGLRPAGGPILKFPLSKIVRNLARTPDFQPGSIIA